MSDAPPLHHDLARAARDLLRAEGAAAGTRLAEARLAARLAVSRTPIRGALRLLEDAGITARRGRAMVVADLSRDLAADVSAEDEALAVAIARARADGRLAETVREADLMRSFDARRGVVSRALERLAKAGVVARNPAQGWHFAPGMATPEEREAAFQFRLAVEPAALRHPGYRADPHFLREMRETYTALLARPWRNSDAVGFFERNAAFHLGLAEGSGNRFFVDAVATQNRLRALLNADWCFGDTRAHTTCREHLLILDALDAGDAAGAAAALDAHLRSAGP